MLMPFSRTTFLSRESEVPRVIAGGASFQAKGLPLSFLRDTAAILTAKAEEEGSNRRPPSALTSFLHSHPPLSHIRLFLLR